MSGAAHKRVAACPEGLLKSILQQLGQALVSNLIRYGLK